jgi:hypothetical protein
VLQSRALNATKLSFIPIQEHDKKNIMKISLLILIFAGFTIFACRAGKGCPTNGRNIGAERILSGDPVALKAVKKAGKFRH